MLLLEGSPFKVGQFASNSVHEKDVASGTPKALNLGGLVLTSWVLNGSIAIS